MNTHVQLNEKHLVTYKELPTDGGPPWDAIVYARLDYILTPGRWAHCITQVWHSPEIQVDAYNFLLRATLRCKLVARKRQHTV